MNYISSPLPSGGLGVRISRNYNVPRWPHLVLLYRLLANTAHCPHVPAASLGTVFDEINKISSVDLFSDNKLTSQ